MNVVEECSERDIKRNDGVIVATVYKCDEQDRLARQFAAGDDLLTACVLFVEARESNDSQLLRVAESAARAAIEKVKGEQS